MAARTILIALGLVLAGTAGCNAVLGIEEAQLDTSEPSDTSQALKCDDLPIERPVESCGTTNGCEQCLANTCSTGEIPSCIQDGDCRKALFRHRVCVRDGCVDETGSCTTCLGEAEGAECFASCGQACSGAELVPLCELFCACMAANCPGKLPVCLADCQAGPTPDFELDCVLSHCELADGPDSLHCQHATHEMRICPDQAPEPVAGCSANQNLNGYGCTEDGDCCSGLCVPNDSDDLTGTCQ